MALVIKDIMDKKTITLMPHNVIKEAIFLLVKYDTRFLPVVNEEGIVVGALSESDLMKLIKMQPFPTSSAVVTSLPKDIESLKISNVMCPRPIVINEAAPVSDALNLMYSTNVKELIVIDNNNKFVGLVRFRNLIEKMIDVV